jgi:hypothetical protein
MVPEPLVIFNQPGQLIAQEGFINMLYLSSGQQMEILCSSETSANFNQTSWHHIPEDSQLHSHHIKSNTFVIYSHLFSHETFPLQSTGMCSLCFPFCQ